VVPSRTVEVVRCVRRPSVESKHGRVNTHSRPGVVRHGIDICRLGAEEALMHVAFRRRDVGKSGVVRSDGFDGGSPCKSVALTARFGAEHLTN